MRSHARFLTLLAKSWGNLSAKRQLPHVRQLTTATITEDNIVRSPFSSVDMPEIPMHEYLFRNLHIWGEKTAVVCSETRRSYTYNELNDISERVAQAFRSKAGLKSGDVLAVLCANVPEMCIAMVGAARAGLVISPINPIYTPEEISKQLKDSNARGIVTMTVFHKIVEAAKQQLDGKQRSMPVYTIRHLPTDTTPEGAADFMELCSYSGPNTVLGRPRSDDLLFLPYSSGTTGLPKGVQLTHRNIVSNLAQIGHHQVRLNLQTDEHWQDIASAVLPMYHIYGLVLVFLNTMCQGCKVVTSPKFHPAAYHRMILEFKPTILYTAPPIVLFLNNFPEIKPAHMENVRRVICGAAPLAPTDIARFNEKFNVKGASTIIQGYGLTEASPLTHSQLATEDTSCGGIGWSIPHTECRILPLDGQDNGEQQGAASRASLGKGESGELAVRGPQVMRGYHNNPEATAETVDPEGWLKTGDIAHYDERGHFFITDRLKELIKVKGFQVAPAELEGILRHHPSILDAAVTGIDDKVLGQAPKAFVVRRPNSDRLTEEAVKEYVASKVAPFKRLTGGVVFVDSIPKNPSGKILRRVLKDL